MHFVQKKTNNLCVSASLRENGKTLRSAGEHNKTMLKHFFIIITLLICSGVIFALNVYQPHRRHHVRAQATTITASPSDIPGLKLWLKADAITGLNDGDPVVTWPDQSGNSNDADQTDTSRQPEFISTVSELANQPPVRFDNTDDGIKGS